MGAPHVVALAADEPQAGGVAGDGEGEGEPLGVLGLVADTGGVDGDLIGGGPQGGEHPRAAYHDAGVGLLLDGQGHLVFGVLHDGTLAGALEVDEGVGESKVVLAHVLVVLEDVVLELRTALGKVVGGASPSSDVAVKEVGGASEHAAASASPLVQHPAAGLQVIHGAWDDEGEADAVAGGGGDVGHLVAYLWVVLHVVEAAEGQHTVAEGRVRGDILHLFTLDPDIAWAVSEALDVLGACTCWHV